MEDLIKAHGWEMHTQNILEIKNSRYLLSVVPEYSFYARDEHGKIHRSLQPQNLILNCAIQSPITMDYGYVDYKAVMYITITSEEEFYDFMIEIGKTVIEENKLPNLNNAV